VRSKFTDGLQKTAGIISGLLGTVAKKAVKNPLGTLNVVGTGLDAADKAGTTAAKLRAARESSGSMLG
jgi:hypothetical protein